MSDHLSNRRCRRAVVTSLVVLCSIVSSCGDDGTGAGGSGDGDVGSGQAETVVVAAIDNSFQPADLQIAAGTAVRWENRGRLNHNVLPTDDSQRWGAPVVDFLPGDDYTFVFDTPGTYTYFCSLHATKTTGMIGTVEVLPAGG